MAINLATIKPAVLKAKEVATVNDIEIAEANFNAAIATTNSYVTTINNTLSDIASDAKLTAGEKQAVKREWETIVAEKPSLVDQATSFGVSSTVYTDKYNALDSYLNTPIGSALLTSLVTTSDIVSSTFTTKFKEYYTAKIDLLNALAAKAKFVADGKVATYHQASIPTAAAIGDLWLDIDDNNKLYRAASIGANEINSNEWVQVGVDVSSQLPTTVESSSLPGSAVYPVGTLWRKSVTINGTTHYDHWISAGAGAWKYIGGTYIDGGNIVTGSIAASKINTTGLVVQEVSPGGLNPTFQIKADGTAGPNGNANIHGARISSGYISSAGGMYIDLVNGQLYIP